MLSRLTWAWGLEAMAWEGAGDSVGHVSRGIGVLVGRMQAWTSDIRRMIGSCTGERDSDAEEGPFGPYRSAGKHTMIVIRQGSVGWSCCSCRAIVMLSKSVSGAHVVRGGEV
jgi:hypothetical protein